MVLFVIALHLLHVHTAHTYVGVRGSHFTELHFVLFFLDYEITNKNSALECLSTMMNYHIMSRNSIGLFLASEARTISRYNACRCEYKCTTSHTRREFSIIRKSMKDIFAYVHQITALIKKSFKCMTLAYWTLKNHLCVIQVRRTSTPSELLMSCCNQLITQCAC